MAKSKLLKTDESLEVQPQQSGKWRKQKHSTRLGHMLTHFMLT